VARERPRPWFALDNAFLTRGSIESLADQFGAAGPLAIVALIAETNAAVGGGKTKDFDVLAWHYAYLGRRVRTDVSTARAIISAAADVGLVEVLDQSETTFTVRLPHWHEWHPKDPGGAERQRRSRARKRRV